MRQNTSFDNEVNGLVQEIEVKINFLEQLSEDADEALQAEIDTQIEFLNELLEESKPADPAPKKEVNKSKPDVGRIFSYIEGINPTVSEISSLGSFVSNQNQQVSDMVLRNVINALPEDTLAYKIATENMKTFSEKQKWVIAYELIKNPEYVEEVNDFYDKLEREAKIKTDRSKQNNPDVDRILTENRDSLISSIKFMFKEYKQHDVEKRLIQFSEWAKEHENLIIEADKAKNTKTRLKNYLARMGKNEFREKNKIAKAEQEATNMRLFGKKNPKLRDVMGAIANREEEKGNIWNPITKDWEKDKRYKQGGEIKTNRPSNPKHYIRKLGGELEKRRITNFRYSDSSTDFGNSSYLITGDLGNEELKVRTSDHSVGSPRRILNEIHLKTDNFEEVVEEVERFYYPERYNKIETLEWGKPLEIKKSALKNEKSDFEIIIDIKRISKRGDVISEIRRRNIKKTIYIKR